MYYQFYQIYFNVLASHYLLLKLFRISNKSRDLLSQANVILLKQEGLMQLFASPHLAPTQKRMAKESYKSCSRNKTFEHVKEACESKHQAT